MNRIQWIDLLKGILLLLICMGHIPDSPEWMRPVINPTAMYYVPMFFVMSGILLTERKKIKDVVERKFRTLIIPYLFFSFCILLIDWNTYIHPTSILPQVHRILILGTSTEKSAPMWFVMTLFTSSILSTLIMKYTEKVWQVLCCAFILSVVAYILSLYNCRLPWLLHLLPSATIFILAGYLIGLVLREKTQEYNIRGFTICLMVFIGSEVAEGGVLGDFHFNEIRQYPLFFVKPIMAAYIVCFVASRLEGYLKKKLFSYIALNGIIILAFHCYLIIVCSHCLKMIGISQASTAYLLLIVTVVSLCLYLIVVPLSNKYLRGVLGK